MRKIYNQSSESLSGKEERIKASYREGIDTLEEYKANKALLQKERIHLEEQLKETGRQCSKRYAGSCCQHAVKGAGCL